MNLIANQIFIYFIFFSFIEIVQLKLYVGSFRYPTNIYLFKTNFRHAGTKCGMCSSLVIKTPERRCSGVFIIFERLVLMFPFLTWKKYNDETWRSYTLPKEDPRNTWIMWHTPWVLLTSPFFHRKSTNFAISRNADIDCILMHNFYLF